MAASQCLRCGSRSFESVVKIPVGFPHRVIFIQCSVCGGVVGVQEALKQNMIMNPVRIDQIQESIKSLFNTQTDLPYDVNTILKHLYG